jgi:hypothetical protein
MDRPWVNLVVREERQPFPIEVRTNRPIIPNRESRRRPSCNAAICAPQGPAQSRGAPARALPLPRRYLHLLLGVRGVRLPVGVQGAEQLVPFAGHEEEAEQAVAVGDMLGAAVQWDLAAVDVLPLAGRRVTAWPSQSSHVECSSRPIPIWGREEKGVFAVKKIVGSLLWKWQGRVSALDEPFGSIWTRPASFGTSSPPIFSSSCMSLHILALLFRYPYIVGNY